MFLGSWNVLSEEVAVHTQAVVGRSSLAVAGCDFS